MMTAANLDPTLSFIRATTGKRKPKRFTNTVGYMALHPEKGVYVGADASGAPVYINRRGMAVSMRDQRIPLFLHDTTIIGLNGIPVEDKIVMHLFQVAALDDSVRNGFLHTDVRRAFHFSSGDVKTAYCERPDEAVHIEPPVAFPNPKHFVIACRVSEAANRLLPFGKQPEYVPLS